MSRTLAIGDIHGRSTAMKHLLNAIQLTSNDQLITLGDYVDRGADSKGVIDLLIQLRRKYSVICLRGNHEIMMLQAYGGDEASMDCWLRVGGIQALQSYNPDLDEEELHLDLVPDNHWFFLKNQLFDWYETDSHIFVHANLHSSSELKYQPSLYLHWEFLNPAEYIPHISGKTMICGHTSQKSGWPLYLGTAICIDTSSKIDPWLTCLHVESGNFWQTNELGDLRTGNIEAIPEIG